MASRRYAVLSSLASSYLTSTSTSIPQRHYRACTWFSRRTTRRSAFSFGKIQGTGTSLRGLVPQARVLLSPVLPSPPLPTKIICLIVIGSHPRIQPVPSERDVAMQHNLQSQVPYCVGVICSPYMGAKQMAQTFYLNAFRVNRVHYFFIPALILDSISVCRLEIEITMCQWCFVLTTNLAPPLWS